jgi:hypothetical protein
MAAILGPGRGATLVRKRRFWRRIVHVAALPRGLRQLLQGKWKVLIDLGFSRCAAANITTMASGVLFMSWLLTICTMLSMRACLRWRCVGDLRRLSRIDGRCGAGHEKIPGMTPSPPTTPRSLSRGRRLLIALAAWCCGCMLLAVALGCSGRLAVALRNSGARLPTWCASALAGRARAAVRRAIARWLVVRQRLLHRVELAQGLVRVAAGVLRSPQGIAISTRSRSAWIG